MAVYEIRVKGHLHPQWEDWFGGLEITNLEGGEAVLSGSLPDQAALHGVLNRMRDFGLPLIAVTSCDPDQERHCIRPDRHRGKDDDERSSSS